jgi:hypothetical protein
VRTRETDLGEVVDSIFYMAQSGRNGICAAIYDGAAELRCMARHGVWQTIMCC